MTAQLRLPWPTSGTVGVLMGILRSMLTSLGQQGCALHDTAYGGGAGFRCSTLNCSWWLLALLAAWLCTMSACDLRTRLVSNWLTLPPLAGILAWQLGHGHWQSLLPLPVIYSLWHLGVLGGADAKVLMSLFAWWPTLEFAAFFCAGHVALLLPILAWRHWGRGKRLLSERLPAIPTYSAVGLAYALTKIL